MVSPLIRQTWTMSAVLINMLGQGLVLGFPFSLLPALNHPDSPIKADLHTSSWLDLVILCYPRRGRGPESINNAMKTMFIGSILGVANIPGFVMSSVFMALYGRRLTHALAMIPGIVGWLMIYFAKDMTTLMAGRFLSGVTTGATVFLGAIVIGEYTSPKYRGVFLYLKNATVCLGATFAHVLSLYLDWRTIALVSSVPLLLTLLIVYTWPESTAWLASRQQYERSERAFYWLRENTEASRREFEEIIKAQKAKLSMIKLKLSYREKVLNFFKKIKQKDFLRPFLIIVLAALVLEMSGRHVFPTYALQIMTEMTGETTQSSYYSLYIDITITVSALFGSILGKMMNRRALLFSTGFSAVIVLISISIYLFFASEGLIPSDQSWIPVSLLALYFVLANFGCAPMPLTLIGEIFPLAHRGAGSALSGIWMSLCLMTALKSTPYLLVNTGAQGLFAVFSCIMGLCLLILYFILPETKDRTLQEIEYYFNYGKYVNTAVLSTHDDEEANTKMIT